MRGFGGLTPKGREQVGDLRTLAKGLENLAVLCEVGGSARQGPDGCHQGLQVEGRQSIRGGAEARWGQQRDVRF